MGCATNVDLKKSQNQSVAGCHCRSGRIFLDLSVPPAFLFGTFCWHYMDVGSSLPDLYPVFLRCPWPAMATGP